MWQALSPPRRFLACLLLGRVHQPGVTFAFGYRIMVRCKFMTQRWSHSVRELLFLRRTKLFCTNLLHPANIVICVCASIICVCVYRIHIFRRLSLPFILSRQAHISSLLFRYTLTLTVTEPPTIHICVVFQCSLFFPSLLSSDNVVGTFNGWIGCCSCFMHTNEFTFCTEKNGITERRGEKK